MNKPKILDQLRNEIRRRGYSYKTEQSYVAWNKRLIIFYKIKHPRDISPEEITNYLNYLAVKRNVAPSTQNQALCAIVFLYKHVLEMPLTYFDNLKRAKKPSKIPVVLTEKEVFQILSNMQGVPKLIISLLYGTGMRISECLRLRV
ncbi:MAG: phage integrase N-terminal SAM-like domain-containing protein [Balneolales bacterium]